MYCAFCGNSVQPGQNFCNRCGRSTAPAASAAPPAPAQAPPLAMSAPPSAPAAAPAYRYSAVPQPSRTARHIHTLGVIWIAVSVFRLIPGLAIMFFGHIGFPFLAIPMRGFLLPFLGGLGAYLTITAVAGIAAGWGLIDRQPWARMFAIVVGCLKLVDFPFGTALGIYTLWVLASPGADVEYNRLAKAG